MTLSGDGVSGERVGGGSPAVAGPSVAPPGFAARAAVITASPVKAPACVPTRVWVLAGGVLVAAIAAIVVLVTGGGGSPELAIARAINLRAGDLPGFTAQAVTSNPADNEIASRARRCPGITDPGGHPGAVKASSPMFQTGSGATSLQLQSNVEIERSSSVVASDLKRVQSEPVQSCLQQVFDGLSIPASNGVPVTIGGVQVTPLPTSRAGASASFGLRVVMVLSALGRSLPFTMDLFGYSVGRDEVSLVTYAVEQPFPPQAEQRLGALLVTRALARPH